MEKRRVVVTGLGTVNPLGNTVAESWAAAKAGQCGIAPITQFDTAGFKCKLAAEVKGFNPEAIVDKKEARKMARFTLLALAAATEAIQDSGIDTEADAKNIGVTRQLLPSDERHAGYVLHCVAVCLRGPERGSAERRGPVTRIHRLPHPPPAAWAGPGRAVHP